MNRCLALAGVFVIALAGCTQPRPDSKSRGCPQALSTWATAGFSGSIAVLKNGIPECQVAYGSADGTTANTPGTVYSIGSITKSFTAAAILRLADEGELRLDDPVGALLPELKGPVGKATVRQLLLHTSGLNGSHGGDTQPMTAARATSAIDRLELVAAPGQRYLYSNAGYTLLALVVQKVSRPGYRAYLKSKIMRLPDGRTAGGFWNGQPAAPSPRARGYQEDGTPATGGIFPGPYWAVEGNGGLAMTVPDLARWTHALFTGRIVSARSTEMIAAPGHPIDKGRSETPGWVATDASVFGEPFLGAAGGGGDIGHNAVAVWVPGRQRVIAIASNKPAISAEDLLRAIGPALATDKPVPTPKGPAPSADLDAATGTYELGTGGSFAVTVRDDRLAVAASGADAVTALFPPPAGVTGNDLREHEARVGRLLAGETREGREERAAFESGIGPIERIDFGGTIVHDGELRTYVSVTSRGKPVLGWFSVNEAGGVEAAEVPATEPPTQRFLPSGDNRYRPDDPGGVLPQVTLTVRAGRLTVIGPDGAQTSARLTG